MLRSAIIDTSIDLFIHFMMAQLSSSATHNSIIVRGGNFSSILETSNKSEMN
jgi:hypothetical protein